MSSMSCTSLTTTTTGRRVHHIRRRHNRNRTIHAVYASSVPMKPREDLVELKKVTTTLRECARKGAASTAVDILVDLGARGFEPDTLVVTAVISACVNGSNIELAQKVYDEMFEKGVCVPDEVAICELARGYLTLNDPPDWASATQLVNGGKVKYGIEPSAVTYNVMLATCAATNDLPRAEEIVDRMVDDEVAADSWTLKAVNKRRAMRTYVRKSLLVDKEYEGGEEW